jgi:DNA repair protein RecN (Recombination protein N)
LIETLRISGLAIVEQAELEFGPGLNVLTGETGAGKSIVLSALALLAGGRASGRGLRDDGESVVEAVFRTDCHPDLEAELSDRELSGDDHELVVRRSIAKGRGRVRISGQLVPASTLAELFAGRLEISSQHDSQALLRSEVHGRLLDRKGGLDAKREAVAEGCRALREIADEIEALRGQERDRAQRRDFLAYQVGEIDEAKLEPGQIEELQTARGRLAHAERLRGDGGGALARISGDAATGDGGAADALVEAAHTLEDLARVDPAFGALSERAAAAGAEAREVAIDLERHLDGIEADPSRLEQIEERLHRVEQLQRKYGASVEAVLRHREEAAAELEALDGADERVSELEQAASDRAASLARDAAALSKARSRTAGKLAREVEQALRELAMPHARFEVALPALDPPEGFPSGPSGLEAPEFRFCANRGEALQPLRRVASGGELSRAFLAIKQALREQGAGMVLVFDEVDAGIGGEVADKVGACLAELASVHQVLCITHLAQIAAHADAHFRVVKQERKSGTRARVERLDADGRVDEIARMAGGARPGAAAREYARELLARCGSE